MKSEEFITKAKELVKRYTDSRASAENRFLPYYDVYVVWSCYILGNMKALLATTLPDNKYFEVTYSGATDQFYFDAYNKVFNQPYNYDLTTNVQTTK